MTSDMWQTTDDRAEVSIHGVDAAASVDRARAAHRPGPHHRDWHIYARWAAETTSVHGADPVGIHEDWSTWRHTVVAVTSHSPVAVAA